MDRPAPENARLPEVTLFLVDAGGGHRSAANALQAAAAERGSPWRLDLVSIQDVLAPLDITRRLTGRSMEQTYNEMVRRQRTGFLVPLLRGLQWTIRRLRKPLVRRVTAFLTERQPVAVVSVFPNFNGILSAAVRTAHPGVPFLVLLTDLADFPPHFWMEPGVDGVLVATETAALQARQLGIPADRIATLSGMVLHPRFYGPARGRGRRQTRLALGLDPDAFVLVVLFGGKGSPEMRPLSEALLGAHPSWQVVAICGDNPRLVESLAEVEAKAGGRLHRLGFTDRVAEYFVAADLLLTKPGPGSLAEAFHLRVPVVTCCNRFTIPQERFNARFLEEKALGVVVRSWREMPAAAAALAADPERLGGLRENVAALPDNVAVYEALDLIEAWRSMASKKIVDVGPRLVQAVPPRRSSCP